MYILEVFIKWLNKRQTKEIIPEKPSFEEVDEAFHARYSAKGKKYTYNFTFDFNSVYFAAAVDNWDSVDMKPFAI